MKYAGLAFLAVVITTYLVWRRFRRTPHPHTVKSYGDLRHEIFKAYASPNNASRPAPSRPIDLDKRLPSDTRHAFESIGLPREENWKQFCDLYFQVVASIEEELAAIDPSQDWYELLSPARRSLFLLDILESQVNNGGFDQYFLNSSGDGAPFLADAARFSGRPDVLALVEAANSLFPGGPSRFRTNRLAQMEALQESDRRKWNELDSQFYDLPLPLGGLATTVGAQLVLLHPDEFFRP